MPLALQIFSAVHSKDTSDKEPYVHMHKMHESAQQGVIMAVVCIKLRNERAIHMKIQST